MDKFKNSLMRSGRWAVVALLAFSSSFANAQPRDVAADVRSIMLEIVHRGDLSRAERLKAYAGRTGVALDDIGTILTGYVASRPDSMSYDDVEYLLVRFSIETLGKLGQTRSKDALREVAYSDNSILRTKAIRSLVSIGGRDLLELADAVVADTARFDDLDRFALYEDLHRYVGAKKHVRDSIPIGDIEAFFRSAMKTEREKGCQNLLREITSQNQQQEQD